ncbi:hypothetical protein NUSPORA_02611 [Nucleospora cyclopteri]
MLLISFPLDLPFLIKSHSQFKEMPSSSSTKIERDSPIITDLSSGKQTDSKDSIELENIYIKKNVDYLENERVGTYRIIRVLGKGSSANVVLAEEETTECLCAIKIVQRKHSGISDKRIYREILISSLLNHPHIVKLIDFYYNEKFFFLVFEYVEGCQLYDQVLKNGKIEENEARKYFRQIISAIDYVHRNSIAHRDLKIENILIDQNDNIKIIDFGLSNFYDATHLMSTFCGSLYFAAPELLAGQRYVGPEVDVWSLGIVLYVMLCGKVPFDDENIRKLQNKIKACKYKISSGISAEARDLILNMILTTNNGRITLNQVKKSEWLNLNYKDLPHNFMLKREPLTELNENTVKALSVATKFQFRSSDTDLRLFLKICKREKGSLGQSQWFKKPIVSLYYLMEEKLEAMNYTSEAVEEIKNTSCKFISETHFPLILHNFVRYTMTNENGSFFNQYFIKNIFEEENDQKSINNSTVPTNSCPQVKKAYFKGLLRGIKVKNIQPEALKQLLLNIFIENSILYEVNEKSYFCSFFYDNSECFFKLTIYFNIILSEHYIVLNCINKKEDGFKVVYKLIKERVSIY